MPTYCSRGSGARSWRSHLHWILAIAASAAAAWITLSAHAGGLSACALADQADVAQAIGSATGPAQPDQIGGCSWMSAKAGISIQPQDGGRAKFEFDRGRIQGAQAIPGLGDDAFGFQSLAGFVQINLLKGDHYVVIILQDAEGANRMKRASVLAANIAQRM